jgi:hypothetical protein
MRGRRWYAIQNCCKAARTHRRTVLIFYRPIVKKFYPKETGNNLAALTVKIARGYMQSKDKHKDVEAYLHRHSKAL